MNNIDKHINASVRVKWQAGVGGIILQKENGPSRLAFIGIERQGLKVKQEEGIF